MSKKIDRAAHGPSWAEVILGAALSLVLGVVLGALLLILRPVVIAKEMPKEKDRDPKAVYFIEGSRDTAKAREAAAKRKSFVEGRSVTVNEDEINTLAAPNAPSLAAAAPKPGEKAKAPDKAKAPEKAKTPEKGKEGDKAAPAAGSSGEALAIGAPNFRINSGVLQVGMPVTVNALGLDQRVIVQARGGFVKDGSVFVYEPNELYFGSCPVHRLPFLSGYVRSKFLAGQPIPEDVKAAWTKLADVKVDGNTLKLTMP